MKSRHIPISQFIQILEEEYIQALIRSKIYPKKKDRLFWEDVSEGKREKLSRLYERNGLASIFEDEFRFKLAKDRVWPGTGLPKFTYKDDYQRLGNGYYPGLEELDERHYFCVDTDVQYKGEVYTIKLADKDSVSIVSRSGSTVRVPKSDVRRILIIETE